MMASVKERLVVHDGLVVIDDGWKTLTMVERKLMRRSNVDLVCDLHEIIVLTVKWTQLSGSVVGDFTNLVG